MLGAALQERGAREEAIVAYRRAIRLRPSEQAPYMRLGLAQAELGRLSDARATFQALLTLDPDLGGGPQRPGRGGPARAQARRGAAALRGRPGAPPQRRGRAAVAGDVVRDGVAESRRGRCGCASEVRRMAPRTPDIDACIERNRARLSKTPPRTDGVTPKPRLTTIAPSPDVAWPGLVWTLVRTDFKARYHGTASGFVWALLKPPRCSWC